MHNNSGALLCSETRLERHKKMIKEEKATKQRVQRSFQQTCHLIKTAESKHTEPSGSTSNTSGVRRVCNHSLCRRDDEQRVLVGDQVALVLGVVDGHL